MKLSDRLTLIANQINKGETMADIGTDHGFLPIHLWEEGICPNVIMADISEGSLQKAAENCSELHPEITFDLRLGNGIDVLRNAEVDVVVIAGMGGILITDILGWDLDKSHTIKKFILQPRNNVGKLRHWLVKNGFIITVENLVREGKFICEVLTVINDDEPFKNIGYDVQFDYPDALVQQRNSLTREYLTNWLFIEETIAKKIQENSKNAEVEMKMCNQKVKRITQLLSELEENHEKRSTD